MAFHVRSRQKHAWASPLLTKPSICILAIILTIIITSPFITSTPARALRTLPEERAPHRCPSTDASPVYIFLHMHKTAGNNLKHALFAFAHRNNLSLHHTCHPSIPDTRFLAWWLNREKSTKSLDCNLDDLQKLSTTLRSKINFVVGHQHHGAHTLFEKRPSRYFTFLRHPLLRKTSHFLHFEPANASISEYLISHNLNYMTKRLATRRPASELALHFRERAIDIDPFAVRAALSAAKTHLTHNFFFVGLHNRYSESVCILSEILNLACRSGRSPPFDTGLDRLAHSFSLKAKRIAKDSANVRGRTIETVRRLSPHVWQKALQAESADVQLFQYAEQLFEAKLGQYEQCRESKNIRQNQRLGTISL